MADQVFETKTPEAKGGDGLINQVYPLAETGKDSSCKEVCAATINDDGSLDLPELNIEGQDKNPELSETQKSLLDSADDAVGKEMWDFGPNAKFTMEGKLGGATSVAHIAELAGLSDLESASVRGLSEELKDEHGFKEKPLSEGKPGDVMVDLDRHRIGIIGTNGNMFHMDRQSVWREMPLTKSKTAKAYSKD